MYVCVRERDVIREIMKDCLGFVGFFYDMPSCVVVLALCIPFYLLVVVL